MRDLLLLARAHADPAQVAVRALEPSVVAALTPGEGPPRSPKHEPNEDSVGALAWDGGAAGVVADSHHGAHAGEALVRAVAAALAGGVPEKASALGGLVLKVEEQLGGSRPEGDRSETTLLVAVRRGRRAIWASTGDSLLLAVRTGSVRPLNAPRRVFAGGRLALAVLADRVGRDAVLDEGEEDLAADEVLVLATDGIEPEMSSLGPEELAWALGRAGAGPLEGRVREFVEKARRRARGGGRDNIGIVALA